VTTTFKDRVQRVLQTVFRRVEAVEDAQLSQNDEVRELRAEIGSLTKLVKEQVLPFVVQTRDATNDLRTLWLEADENRRKETRELKAGHVQHEEALFDHEGRLYKLEAAKGAPNGAAHS
jgi:hypothetical protein